MEFDYCNVDHDETNQQLLLDVGCKFQDEPDELYVIQLKGEPSGALKEVRLLFNMMDCKYSFKEDELAALLNYVRDMLKSTDYSEWFQGGLHY
ncbi:hypothetical protein [Paenibacillus sp. UNC451MF]|uniref:hypothetical protein n=1 Tax=Paenibacillus sp. UNC451MF TaxID=1449063 RepID=UPI000689424C|nr:hypothetical protein [Paenibacillus sp. UNC451MF]